MKKNKIIGIAVASLGIVFSVGGAFALYTKSVGSVDFNIGAATHTSSTSTVTYKINGATSGNVAPSYLKSNGKNVNNVD